MDMLIVDLSPAIAIAMVFGFRRRTEIGHTIRKSRIVLGIGLFINIVRELVEPCTNCKWRLRTAIKWCSPISLVMGCGVPLMCKFAFMTAGPMAVLQQ